MPDDRKADWEGQIMPEGEREQREARARAYQEWLESTYTPAQIKAILSGEMYDPRVGNIYWDYFLRNVLPPPALPIGRPQPEKYGLTDNDWQTLMMIGGNPKALERELTKWYQSEKINDYQVRDILEEIDVRLSRARGTLLATGFTEEEWPAEYQRRITESKKAKEQERLAYAGRHGMLFDRPLAKPVPFTEYGVGLEEMRTGFEVLFPQTQRWKEWFRSKYPRMIEQFEAKPEEQRTKVGWAEYLKKRKTKVREEWYKQTPYERGERPSAFAPRIKTVGF